MPKISRSPTISKIARLIYFTQFSKCTLYKLQQAFCSYLAPVQKNIYEDNYILFCTSRPNTQGSIVSHLKENT